MKKLIYLVLFMGFLFLFGCNRATILSDDGDSDINEKIIAIQGRLINGEITQEQAQEMTQNIGSYSVEDIMGAQKTVDLLQNFVFPDWAKNLGLTEPVGMVLDNDISKITSVDDENEGFDSVIFVYKGDYEQSIQEASRIAQLASLPISKEFEQAKEIEKNSPDIVDQMGDDVKNSMKGIVYSNHDLTDTNIEYLISISVDEDGTLTINASNYEQMKEALKKE